MFEGAFLHKSICKKAHKDVHFDKIICDISKMNFLEIRLKPTERAQTGHKGAPVCLVN